MFESRFSLILVVSFNFLLITGLSEHEDTTTILYDLTDYCSDLEEGEFDQCLLGVDFKLDHDNKTICESPSCIVTTMTILQKMDETIAPCDDFYQFACGKFIKDTVIHEDRSEESIYTRMADKLHKQVRRILEAPIGNDEINPVKYLKQYFQKCVNQNATELNDVAPALRILNQIGTWPVLEQDKWKDQDFDLYNVTYKLRKLGLPYNNIFSVDHNSKHLTSNNSALLIINSPEFLLEEPFFLGGFNSSNVKAYYDLVVNISVALGAEKNYSKTEFYKAMMFEIQLANITRSTGNLNIHDITMLNTFAPEIPWINYINSIIDVGNIQVDKNTELYVDVVYFIFNLNNLLKTTPKRVQANYIMSRILFFLAPYLNEEIQHFQLEYERAIYGIGKSPIKWKKCLNEIPDGLLEVASSLYVRNFFEFGKKEKTAQMITELKTAFVKIIHGISWMDNSTKLKIVKKINTMDSIIGYPEALLDDKYLKNFYENLTIAPNDAVAEIVIKANKVSKDFYFLNLNKSAENMYWSKEMEATSLFTSSNTIKNLLIVPAAILQDLTYDTSKSHYINYGSLGSILAYQMVHLFLAEGKYQNKFGKDNYEWESSTKDLFRNVSHCLIEKFNSYTVPKLNLKIDGAATLYSNIADNGALKISRLAYQNLHHDNGSEKILPRLNYSPNQLFWISFAQHMCSVKTDEDLSTAILDDYHAPRKFRVTGIVSESDDFAIDFNCPIGSNMNPADKCLFWE